MNRISVKEVRTKAELKEFIYLPEKIHKDDKRFVPPFYADEWEFHNERKNPAISACEQIRFIAFKDNVAAGRIMAIINHPYNKARNELNGRFFLFECINDIDVATLLLQAAEDWLKQKGMKKVIGPFGYSDKDPQGVQIEGFEYLPVIATANNSPYLHDLIVINGYSKLTDCVVYKMPFTSSIPEIYLRIYERAKQQKTFSILEFKTRSELKPYVVPVLRLVNETYSDLMGFTPMTEDEMKVLAKKYLPVLDPEFTKVILNKEKQPVAFIVASPDISKGVMKARGRIFPFGFLYILSELKKSKQLDFFLGAVRKDYQSRGLTALLAVPLFRSAIKRKMEFADSHLILENNLQMRKTMEQAGGEIYKRYRIFQKQFEISSAFFD